MSANHYQRPAAALVAAASITSASTAQVYPLPYIGVAVGQPVEHGAHECIQGWERAEAVAKVAKFRATHAPFLGPNTDGPSLFTFPPYGANLFGDIAIADYVDLDPASPDVLTWECDGITYDGHTGSDNTIRWFSEQAVGIPVFAALDGVVEATDDGHPDMNTGCDGNPPANYVILDNGGGKETYYWHFKLGSVAVSPGQVVHAGQQLGLVGSSGCSNAPHLHFETRINGNIFEPYAGSCRAGASGWANQPLPPPTARVFDFGATTTDLSTVPQYPYRYPVDAQILASNQHVYYWVRVQYLPANSNYRFTFVRPDGTVSYASEEYPFNYPDLLGDSIWYFIWDIPEMHTIFGTWHVRIDFNGLQVVDAPIDVVQSVTQGFNRPPLPVTLAFDPVTPQPGAPVFCRITSSLTLRDPDWDVVRYHWVWKRNGMVVRDVTTAGMADAIAGGITAAGDVLDLTVTTNDGQVDGPPTSMHVAIGCYANCDASTVSPRLNVADFTCFLQQFASGSAYANCDASTAPPTLNVADFTCFLQRFAAGCP